MTLPIDQPFRLTPPPSGDIRMPNIPPHTVRLLPNGVRLCVLPGGAQPVVKVEVSVRAGTARSERAAVARAAASLLTEGTEAHSAQEIAETLDFFGASIVPSCSLARVSLAAVSLQRDVRKVVDLLSEILLRPAYPDGELDIYKAQELQNLEVQKMRSSNVASKLIAQTLYDDGDRRARFATRESFEALTPALLSEFHGEAYVPNDAYVFVSGRPSDADVEFIAETFGSESWASGESWAAPKPRFRQGAHRRMVEHDGEQTSVRIARPLFDRKHPDFIPFQLVNAAFGGYFGSRIMQDVRERLGLTYGIYSAVAVGNYCGTHSISSEVKTGSHEVVVEEVFREMRRMADSLLSEREMQTMRGYLLSEILRNFDTVFTTADAIFDLLLNGVDTSVLVELYDAVRCVGEKELRSVAARWLVPEEYSVVCVGKGVQG